MPKHWHTHQGSIGCIPETWTYHDTREEAVKEAERAARDDRSPIADIAERGYAYLRGMTYVGIVECDDPAHKAED